MRKRKIISILVVLMLSASLVFAASAESLYSDFRSSVENGNVEAAMKDWTELQERIEKEEASAQKNLEKARQKGDRNLYANALAQLRTLAGYTISRSDTDSLLTAIVNGSGDTTAQAAWLYETSRYYRPTLTLESSVTSTGYSSAYRRSFILAPGSAVKLPETVGASTSAAGVLSGWGITPDEVTYQPGETITMPLTDQTLYAIFVTSVSFSDPNGEDIVMTDVEDGDVISVPSPAALEGAIFDGWYDGTSGQYIAPGETEYTVVGKGAAFTPLYIKAEASELDAGHYAVDSIPTGTQIPLSFTISNSGSETLDNVTIEIGSESSYVRLMGTSARLARLAGGKDVRLTGTRLVIDSSCPSGTEIPLTVTIKDGDGNAFTSTFTLATR